MRACPWNRPWRAAPIAVAECQPLLSSASVAVSVAVIAVDKHAGQVHAFQVCVGQSAFCTGSFTCVHVGSFPQVRA